MIKSDLHEFWLGFKEGVVIGIRRTPAFYFEPVIVTWRWMRRGMHTLGQHLGWR
ncbi:hypothetical protein [Massilia endophytica]|uniref:hypothetical protein n=1 Tax=Massilia endophytica TaxID=2899220 RepID=UPI001E412A75|nr:hypothetical protein [Massilia endophytica]UGQ44774.1 hypothetical protein LSQ66_13280 [Massilia endophytica]